jgi:hypothetical protein
MPITVGAYAYLDSDLFVRLSIAMDAIIDALCKKRNNVSLAYLCTPTDCHVITPAAHDAQIQGKCAEAHCFSIHWSMQCFSSNSSI